MPPPPSSAAPAFRPDVEGLRAIAIVAVLLCHAGLPFFAGGYVGVDVFFVISGFLITRLLLGELEGTGGISLRRFYARRRDGCCRSRRSSSPPSASSRCSCSHRCARSKSRGTSSPLPSTRPTGASPPSRSTTSLRTSNRARSCTSGRSRSRSSSMLSGRPCCSRSPGSRAAAATPCAPCSGSRWRSSSPAPSRSASSSPPTSPRRLLLDLRARLGARPRRRPGARRRGLAPPRRRGGPRLGRTGRDRLRGGRLRRRHPVPGRRRPRAHVGTALLIVGGASLYGQARAAPAALLSLGPVRYVGRISYSWYLWHWPALIFAAAAWGSLSVAAGLAVVAASLVPTVITHHLIEDPVRLSRALSRRPNRALAVGFACMAIGVCAGFALKDAQPQLDTAPIAQVKGAAALPEQPYPRRRRRRPPGSAARPRGPLANVRRRLPGRDRRTNSNKCLYGDAEGKRTLILYGDSHALQCAPPWKRSRTRGAGA